MMPHVSMTSASLGPFSTGPLKQSIMELAATSRTYQASVAFSITSAANRTRATMLGTNRRTMNVIIDAELDFFMMALKKIAIPVRAKAYSMQ